MTDKLTDTEIKEALEFLKSKTKEYCEQCAYKNSEVCDICIFGKIELALDLINRLEGENTKNENIIRIADKTIATLNAENESLKAEAERLWLCIDELKKLVGKHEPNYDPSEEVDAIVQRITISDAPSLQVKIKAEAYKEFADRLKKIAIDVGSVTMEIEVDNLLNELVGE